MIYSVCLINSKGEESFLFVKGKFSWKTKRAAVKHAKEIVDCKKPPFDTKFVIVENEFREMIIGFDCDK